MRNEAEAEQAGRGVAATWWYTFSSAVFFAVVLLVIWAAPLIARAAQNGAGDVVTVIVYLLAGLVWIAAFIGIAAGYRFSTADSGGRFDGFVLRATGSARRPAADVTGAGGYTDADGDADGPRVPDTPRTGPSPARLRRICGVAGIVAALGAGSAAASVTLAVSLVAAVICVLPWPRGARGRLTGVLTVLIAVLAWSEYDRLADGGISAGASTAWLMALLFAVLLPLALVSTLWWWDIVRELDRARLAESELAATRERLRLASDVHDLQGHHLQVIALQLELADRLIGADRDSAREQIHAAQRSVDEARAGTRALAARFRGVPLPDEVRNAADLLRAAGLAVSVDIAAESLSAPGDALGPVIRECTTNILKHGGGGNAALRLVRDGRDWVFRAENDAAGGSLDGAGSGVAGMTARVTEAGGSMRTGREGGRFLVEARVPAVGEGGPR